MILRLPQMSAFDLTTLLIKLLQRRTPTDTLALTAWQLLFGCVPLLIVASLVEGSAPDWTPVFLA